MLGAGCGGMRLISYELELVRGAYRPSTRSEGEALQIKIGIVISTQIKTTHVGMNFNLIKLQINFLEMRTPFMIC